jgi:hypothetical protein
MEREGPDSAAEPQRLAGGGKPKTAGSPNENLLGKIAGRWCKTNFEGGIGDLREFSRRCV